MIFDIIIIEYKYVGLRGQTLGELMKNILIVCADKMLRKDIGEVLAKELGFLYADIDEILDYEILNHSTGTIVASSEKFQQLETDSVVKALDYNNCVLTISCNMFVSNANFKLFNIPKIFVRLSKSYMVARFTSDTYKLEQELLMFDKINKLIEINCDVVIDKDIKSIADIAKQIISDLKN